MQVLLAGNVPKFHVIPHEDAYRRMETGLKNIYTDDDLHRRFYGEFIHHYREKYKVSNEKADLVLKYYLESHLIHHMACRVGIENWPTEAITTWIRNYFGAKQLPHVITQAHEIWEGQQPQPKVMI